MCQSVDYDAEETQCHPDDLEASPQSLPLSPLWSSWLDFDSPASRRTSDALVPRASPSGHSSSSSSYYTIPDGASLHSTPFTEDTSAGPDAESMHILGSVHGDLSEVRVSVQHSYSSSRSYPSISHYHRRHDFVGCEPDNSGEQPDCGSCHTPSPDLSRDACRYLQEEKAPF